MADDEVGEMLAAFGRLDGTVRDLAIEAANIVCTPPWSLRVTNGTTLVIVDTSGGYDTDAGEVRFVTGPEPRWLAVPHVIGAPDHVTPLLQAAVDHVIRAHGG